MPQKISARAIFLTFGVLAVSFLAAFYSLAWTEPSQTPPAGNVPAPINVGSVGQSKAGNLMLNTDGTLAYGLLVPYGRVGIGTTSPAEQLHVKSDTIVTRLLIENTLGYTVKMLVMGSTAFIGGGSGVGLVLQTDGNNRIYITSAGNVGIGTTTPAHPFVVNSAATTAFNVTSAGNVGIGTMSPSQKLDVQGGDMKVGTVIIKGDGSVSTNLNAAKAVDAQNAQNSAKLEDKTVQQIQQGGLFGYCHERASGGNSWIVTVSAPAIQVNEWTGEVYEWNVCGCQNGYILRQTGGSCDWPTSYCGNYEAFFSCEKQ